MKIYQVGGCVRDKFIGRKSKDIDYAVEGLSFSGLREEILKRDGQIFVEKPEYFTIRAKLPKFGVADYTLCREDGPYSDNRRPDYVVAGTILSDLARRDFTMNAIALTEEGAIIDPHGGVNDIKMGTIRCVGSTQERISEDPIRALRAIRFCIQLQFTFAESLYNFLFEYDFIPIVETVSSERIREELYKMFSSNSKESIRMFKIFPQLTNLFEVENLWLKPTLEIR